MNFFLLDKQYIKTPKGEEELPLMLAGLGKRSLSISENMTHSEVCYDLFTALCQLISTMLNFILMHDLIHFGTMKYTVMVNGLNLPYQIHLDPKAFYTSGIPHSHTDSGNLVVVQRYVTAIKF